MTAFNSSTHGAGRLAHGLRWLKVFLNLCAGIVVLPWWILRTRLRRGRNLPRIGLSLDNRWLHQLRVASLMYDVAIVRSGGRVVTLKPTSVHEPVDAAGICALLDGIDGLVISGGGDVDPNLYGGHSEGSLNVKPWRDRFELALLAEARRRRMPILAICRGCQLLNVSLGGSLINMRTDRERKRKHFNLIGHQVSLSATSRLREILDLADALHVNSYHGQAVDRLGHGIRVAARAPDGVIEAIECDPNVHHGWFLGLQWHPEMTLTNDRGRRLFEALIQQAKLCRPG